MRVEIYTNAVAGGWLPGDLETFLGGSEEVIVLFARELSRRGCEVVVYHTRPLGVGDRMVRDASGSGAPVTYLDRQLFDAHAEHDVLITWKDRRPWQIGAKARVAIHWSSDVEPPWHAASLDALDHFICLTPYHRGRLPWLRDDLARVIPHGIDWEHLNSNRRLPWGFEKALYCSSPDRGLERLLADWPRIREQHHGLELRVAYGWGLFDRIHGGNPAARVWKEPIEMLLRQEGVSYLGQLTRAAISEEYSYAHYWLLPLERPDAELFCLNAVKAQLAGCMPIINKIGGLQDTVRWGQDYPAFVSGEDYGGVMSPGFNPGDFDWSAIVEKHWLPLLEAAAAKEAA
jgi:hypothetical protein